MNKPTIDYCIGAANTYYKVLNDLGAMLDNKQENWYETIVDYVRITNNRMQKWLYEAHETHKTATILGEDLHYGK